MQVSFDTAVELKNAIDELFRDYSVALYFGLDSVAPFPDYQSHNGFELYYVWEGEGSYWVEDNVYPLEPGSLMIIPPFTMHKVVQSNVSKMVSRHVLILKEGILAPDTAELIRSMLLKRKTACIHIVADGIQRQKVEAIYKDIYSELTGKEQGFDTMIRSYIQQLLTMVHRIEEQVGQTGPIHHSNHIPREIIYLVQYIGMNFQHSLKLDQLARLVHMNPPYLTTLFHKYTGYPVGKFITQKRLHHARKLLRENDKSVAHVALESGFSGSSYFIKLFKRQEGITPETYRKLHRHDRVNPT